MATGGRTSNTAHHCVTHVAAHPFTHPFTLRRLQTAPFLCLKLTPAGERAVALYRKMEAEALAATEKSWRQFQRLLKPSAE